MKRAKKKVVSGILGVSLSVMLAGSCVFAAGGSYKILSGDNGTYNKGSKSGYVIKVDGAYADFESVAVDGKTIVKDKDYSVSGTTASDSKEEETKDETTTEAPETPDVDETTEVPTTVAPDPTTAAPDPTTQAPDPTTAGPAPTEEGPEVTPAPTTWAPTPSEEVPATWEPTPSEEVPATWEPTATQSAENGKSVFLTVKDLLKAIVNPVNAEAASNETTVKVFSSYMDTLSVGTHKIAVNFENGSATATVTVKDNAAAKTTSATPKTGDTSNVTLFAFLALVSGAIIVVEGKKKFSK